jgi:RNA polymerase sigma-70 factor (ECF subfamily)
MMTHGSPEHDFERFRQRRDAAALARVFDALAPELVLVAAHFARQSTEAEDLVQATFLDAIRHAARWDMSRPLLPWLCGILTNHARLEQRRARRVVDPERLALREEPGPLAAAEQRELAEELARVLAKLPRHYRQVLSLRLLHGLTPLQIAHALGSPPATVKTRLQRGIAALRQALPAGLATVVLACMTTPRALAAVREAVLAQAAASIGPLAVAAGTTGGILAMKKLSVIVGGALIALVLWTLSPWPTAEPAPERSLVVAPEPGSVAVVNAPVDQRVAERIPAVPASPPSGAAVGPGSLRVEFVWSDDGEPAAGIPVTSVATDEPARNGRATTDRVGIVAFAELAPGRYMLFGRQQYGTFDVRPGEETFERIAVRPSVRLTGTVVDGNGQGMPGASIRVQRFDDPRDLAPLTVATTDADGTFSFAAEFAGEVWAQHPGFVPSEYRMFPDGGTARIDFVLASAGHALRGIVLGPSGPVSDALVAIHSAARPAPFNPTAPKHERPPVSVTTDRDGRFATDELPPGEAMLLARAEGLAPAIATGEPAPGAAPVTIRMIAGASLRGTVRDGHGNARHASIEVWPAFVRDGYELSRVHFLASRTVTDDAGRYLVSALPPGKALVEVRSGDLVTLEAELDLVDGQIRAWDPVLAAGGDVRGRVLGPGDAPLAEWEIVAEPVGGGDVRQVWSDAAGSFTLTGLTAAEYRVLVRPNDREFDGRGARSIVWAEAMARPGAGDLVVRVPHSLVDAARILARVVGRDGAPIANAHLQIAAAGRSGPLGAEPTDTDGRAACGPLPPGRYRLAVDVHDYGRVTLGEHELAAGARLDLGTVRLGGRGTATIRVLLPDGAVVPYCELRMFGAGNVTRTFTPVDGGGRRSEPLPEGSYTVHAWGETFAPVQASTPIAADRDTPVDLFAQPAVPVRFELQLPAALRERAVDVVLDVRDHDGRSLPVGAVRIGPQHGSSLARGFAAGSYRVSAESLDRALRGEVRFTVPAGGDAPISVPLALTGQ